jgi:hypothetical protein
MPLGWDTRAAIIILALISVSILFALVKIDLSLIKLVYLQNLLAKLWKSCNPLVLLSVFVLFFYALAYVRSGGTASWYFASFLIPSSIVTVFYLDLLALPVSLAIGSFALYLVISFHSLTTPLWPHHADMFNSAQTIASQGLPGVKRLGVWNAGIISYFSGSSAKIINLDGLVNDHMGECILDQRSIDCFDNLRLDAFLDFPSTYDSGHLGFNSAYFKSRYSQQKQFYALELRR